MAVVALSSSPRRRFWKDRPSPPPPSKDAAGRRKRANRAAKRCESESAVRRDRRNSQGKHRQKHPSDDNNNNGKDDPGDGVIDLRCRFLHLKESIFPPSLADRPPSRFSGVAAKESVSPPHLVDHDSRSRLPILKEFVFPPLSMDCSSSSFSVIAKESISPPPSVDYSFSRLSVAAEESISSLHLADNLPSRPLILKEYVFLPPSIDCSSSCFSAATATATAKSNPLLSLADCSPSCLPILKGSISSPSLVDCSPSPYHPIRKESISSPSLPDCSPSSPLPTLKRSINSRPSLAHQDQCSSSEAGLSEEAEFSLQSILPGSENHHRPKPSSAIKNSFGLNWKSLLFCEQDLRKTDTPSPSKPTKGGSLGQDGPRQYFHSGKAWRPDDSSRPASLPMLPRQNGFSQAPGETPADLSPPSCPICAEELDSTDCSFTPCPCQFRLCLFCHHRILLEDGRCPGCRKAYSH